MATGQNSALERLTVNLTERTAKAMRLTANRTGDTKTDVVNRHIQEGAYLEWVVSVGGSVWVREPGDQHASRLRFIPGATPAPTFSEAVDATEIEDGDEARWTPDGS